MGNDNILKKIKNKKSVNNLYLSLIVILLLFVGYAKLDSVRLHRGLWG